MNLKYFFASAACFIAASGAFIAGVGLFAAGDDGGYTAVQAMTQAGGFVAIVLALGLCFLGGMAIVEATD